VRDSDSISKNSVDCLDLDISNFNRRLVDCVLIDCEIKSLFVMCNISRDLRVNTELTCRVFCFRRFVFHFIFPSRQKSCCNN